ncbi:MAG: hypothetical protein M0C28_27915 [Candidatus Moduliflexus flocculans]|nr:hypothetical protein [Candidatus Moduliflexus flocculans]
MAAGVHAGDEVGPGDRGLGRQARPERPEIAALFEQLAEGRQTPFVDPPLASGPDRGRRGRGRSSSSSSGPGRRPWARAGRPRRGPARPRRRRRP